MPHYQYDTPRLSPRVKQQNEYRYWNRTAAAAHHVCEVIQLTVWRPAAWKGEEVQSCSASVVHPNGQNTSAAQTTAAAPSSIASSLADVHQSHMCLPARGLSQQGPSTFPPLGLLLRSAQQHACWYPQTCQPRRLMLSPSQQSVSSAAIQSARTSRALRSRGKLPPANPSSAFSIRRPATSMPGVWGRQLATAAITPPFV